MTGPARGGGGSGAAVSPGSGASFPPEAHATSVAPRGHMEYSLLRRIRVILPLHRAPVTAGPPVPVDRGSP